MYMATMTKYNHKHMMIQLKILKTYLAIVVVASSDD
jgi:hypothetical protein